LIEGSSTSSFASNSDLSPINVPVSVPERTNSYVSSRSSFNSNSKWGIVKKNMIKLKPPQSFKEKKKLTIHFSILTFRFVQPLKTKNVHDGEEEMKIEEVGSFSPPSLFDSVMTSIDDIFSEETKTSNEPYVVYDIALEVVNPSKIANQSSSSGFSPHSSSTGHISTKSASRRYSEFKFLFLSLFLLMIPWLGSFIKSSSLSWEKMTNCLSLDLISFQSHSLRICWKAEENFYKFSFLFHVSYCFLGISPIYLKSEANVD